MEKAKTRALQLKSPPCPWQAIQRRKGVGRGGEERLSGLARDVRIHDKKRQKKATHEETQGISGSTEAQIAARYFMHSSTRAFAHHSLNSHVHRGDDTSGRSIISAPVSVPYLIAQDPQRRDQCVDRQYAVLRVKRRPRRRKVFPE